MRARARATATLACLIGLGCSEPPSEAATARAAEAGTCLEGDESLERHGTACLCCHEGEFGVAGSVAPDSPVDRITVIDAVGQRAVMAPNPYDNFFRHVPMEPPLSVTMWLDDGTTKTMTDAPSGDCNTCHGIEGSAPRL
jgi:hypothetical protein